MDEVGGMAHHPRFQRATALLVGSGLHLVLLLAPLLADALERPLRELEVPDLWWGLCLSVNLLALPLCGWRAWRRRPLRVSVRLHELRIGRLRLPWPAVRSVWLGPGGCYVTTFDGRVLLEGYFLDPDGGTVARAARTALALHRERQGPVPPELEALRRPVSRAAERL